jgi:hypothetical protein
MPSRQKTKQPLSPELVAIATAAGDRLRAQCGDDRTSVDEHSQRVADAASAAIHAGAALAAIAEAERVGEERARQELRTDLLRKVDRAAKKKREADTDYEHAVHRAARLGLSHRDIATAAQVTHGSVRALLARADTNTLTATPAPEQRGDGQVHEQHTSEPLAA